MNRIKNIVIILTIFISGCAGFVVPTGALVSHQLHPSYSAIPLIGSMIISTSIPDNPNNVTLFKVTPQSNDIVDYSTPDLAKIKSNVTSEADAPIVVQNVLLDYGGLPPGSQLNSVVTGYAKQIDLNTGQILKKYPISTRVQYSRSLDGIPVVGRGGYIDVELGENGEVLDLIKIWRTVTPSGKIKIIPATTALEKMNQKDVMNPLREWYDLNVTQIQLGYYEKGLNESQEFLEPVWIIKGIAYTGEPISYYVYARQFANFTCPTPTSGKVPLTVRFNDTSEAMPVKWLWDFGDNSNSTDQNPVHIYTTAGTYTVSLKAWNDLGSDTMERPALVTVKNPAPPVANFTAVPVTGYAPLNVVFNDTSTNAPTIWIWTFGDGINTSMQNPVHTYITAGNYTVLLNVTNEDGSDSIIKTNYIAVSNLPLTTITTHPTTTVTTLVTTKPTTTKPTPTKTHAPLSPVPVIIAISLTGLLILRGKRQNK